ncbi:MAG TPA: helix-turn-helix transcriptional regulator [Candidatus Limnocylindrales bacterium]|nr:helix-turn-helix transcriptional regulator [Candidatus Limnocylindrales bacterium]
MPEINERARLRAHRTLLRRIGEQIVQMRDDAGWSQRRVAAAAGISRSHLAAVEAGAAEPSLQLLGRIGAALGATSGSKASRWRTWSSASAEWPLAAARRRRTAG